MAGAILFEAVVSVLVGFLLGVFYASWAIGLWKLWTVRV